MSLSFGHGRWHDRWSFRHHMHERFESFAEKRAGGGQHQERQDQRKVPCPMASMGIKNSLNESRPPEETSAITKNGKAMSSQAATTDTKSHRYKLNMLLRFRQISPARDSATALARTPAASTKPIWTDCTEIKLRPCLRTAASALEAAKVSKTIENVMNRWRRGK